MKVHQFSPFASSIAVEPHISKVRVFATNINNTQKVNATSSCDCPHILVADDDSFQHMYYRLLFEKLCLSKEASKLHLSLSGEELLIKLAQVKDCGCKSLKLVISDYHMGKTNIDGVTTCLKVRKTGYNGAILLRTSETQEYLKNKHENFEELLEEEVINQVISKAEAQQDKELIRNALMT